MRVRLLVAIPVVIVLLLSIMGGCIYHTFFIEMKSHTFDGARSFKQTFAQFFLAILIVFDIVGAVVGYILAYSITRPIHKLIEISQRVAGGDFSNRADIHTGDEVAALGMTFNDMVESLNRYITNRNRFVLESFSGGLITTDVNGTIATVNSAAGKILALEPEDAVGKPARAVLTREEHVPLVTLIEEALWKKEPIVSRDIEMRTMTDGSLHAISVNCSPMRDEHGGVFGLVVNFRDVGEWRKFHEQMGRTDRLAAVGTFATGLAHEIRNPLAAIKGTAQLLDEDVRDNARAHEYVQVIIKEVNRLDGLVREVQEYSQPSAARCAPTNLNTVVSDILLLARNNPNGVLAEGVRIEERLSTVPESQLPQDKITQALLNILLNACQATPEDGTIIVQTAFVADDPLPLQVSISNTGSSIAAENMVRVFEPFYTTKDRGSGLGLPIAYEIVRHYGGDIAVRSTDSGVTFTVKLPLQTPPEEPSL